MKKTYAVIAILIVLAVVYSAFHFAKRISPVQSPQSVVSTKTSAPKKNIEIAPLASENASTTYAEMSLSYPKSDETHLKEVFDYVQGIRSDFWGQYGNLTDAQAQSMFIQPDNQYQLFLNTRVATSTQTVTYIIESYEYLGGAHGGTSVSTFTYDLNGKLITIDDVFTPDYLSVISSMSRQHFYDSLGEYAQPEMIDAGTEATTTNFSTWYLTDDTITFIFGQYQVGPYVLGLQEYPIKKSDIVSILKPAFR